MPASSPNAKTWQKIEEANTRSAGRWATQGDLNCRSTRPAESRIDELARGASCDRTIRGGEPPFQQLYDTFAERIKRGQHILDHTAELLQRGFVPQAGKQEASPSDLDQMKRGVERARKVCSATKRILRMARNGWTNSPTNRTRDTQAVGAGAGGTNARTAGPGLNRVEARLAANQVSESEQRVRPEPGEQNGRRLAQGGKTNRSAGRIPKAKAVGKHSEVRAVGSGGNSPGRPKRRTVSRTDRAKRKASVADDPVRLRGEA